MEGKKKIQSLASLIAGGFLVVFFFVIWLLVDGRLLIRDVPMVIAKHSSIHEWYALVVLLLGSVCRDVHFMVYVFVVEDFSCEFHVVVCCYFVSALDVRS